MKTDKEMPLTQNDIANIYNGLFKEEGRLRDTDSFYSWVFNSINPPSGSIFLDVACGEGLLIKKAYREGVMGFGIDLSSQAAILTRNRLGTSVVSVANGENLPFADQSFDFVTNIGSLEHFLKPNVGISEMIRVLKPNGRIALFLPNSYYLADLIWNVWRTGYGPSHRQPLERFATFREWWDFMEKCGLRVIKAYKYNSCMPRSRSDWRWYRQHPRKIINLLVSPFIPFNFSNHFLYLCSRA